MNTDLEAQTAGELASLKAKAAVVDGPAGSEASFAEYLASTDLAQRLRWRAEGEGEGRWHDWVGTHWQLSNDRIPLALQAAVHRAVASGLESHRIDPRVCLKLESASAIRGIGALLSAWPSMRLPPDIDPPGLLAVPAGVFDLVSGKLLPHDPARPITRCCPVNPRAGCDLWALVEAHLQMALGARYNAFHRLLGSSLLGRGADRRLAWAHGPGGDGKSTLAKLLRAALGEHCVVVPAEVFAVDGARGAHLHELGTNMAGSRLAISLELAGRPDWAKLKGLSGGDEQRTKKLHGRSFSYARPPVLLLISNEPPSPPDRASAERLVVAELTPPADPDDRLMTTLLMGGEGRDRMAGACLEWLLRGCAQFQANEGLGPVTLYGHAPMGLSKWWAEAIERGRIIPGAGWSPLAALRHDLEQFAGADGWPVPRDNELALFLRSSVAFRRTKSERLYQFRMVVTPGDASEPSSSHAYGETVIRRHQASPEAVA